LVITGGQRNDGAMLEQVLADIRVPRPGTGRPRTRPDAVVADRAYSSGVNRRALASRGITTVIGWVSGAALGAGLEPGALSAQVLHQLGRSVESYILLIGGVLLLVTIIQFPNGLAAMHSELAEKLRLRWHRKPRTPALEVPAEVSGHRVDPKQLEVTDLTARFGGVTALTGLSMTVEPGEIVGLIGPKGAGKSTAVDGITGFIPGAVSGTVSLDGEPIDSWSQDKRARAGLGRSFQSLELFDDMTVLENLQAASEPQDTKAYVTDLVTPGRIRLTAACLAAIKEFGLEPYLDSWPTELPYGRRRLVAIARAVAAEPSVLLLDEPAAGLDEVESRELGELISRLAREWGMAVLLIEHDVSMVMRLCDRIYALEFGHCIAAGTPAEIRADEKVVASYLGSTEEVGHAAANA
jgi:ABC-type branched-subunit amino acid transport system ATPase component